MQIRSDMLPRSFPRFARRIIFKHLEDTKRQWNFSPRGKQFFKNDSTHVLDVYKHSATQAFVYKHVLIRKLDSIQDSPISLHRQGRPFFPRPRSRINCSIPPPDFQRNIAEKDLRTWKSWNRDT